MGKKIVTVLFPLLGMLALILDAQCAMDGAAQGVSLCLRTVIPSLFPLFFLSSWIGNGLTGLKLGFLRPIGQLLRLPQGGESFFLIGMTGGYPIGAKTLAEACREGRISACNFRRMIAFCSNTGPGFLFGMGAVLFSNRAWCFAAWLIHIASACLVGFLTPGGEAETMVQPEFHARSTADTLHSAIKATAMVCGWVVIFRVLLAFLQRWILWLFPAWLSILMQGFLELTNGCCDLYLIEEEGLRFVFFTTLLGFGGLCVTMQTMSFCKDLPAVLYIPGKLTQSLLSALLSALWISQEITLVIQFGICALFVCSLYYLFTRQWQKRLDLRSNLQYNL